MRVIVLGAGVVGTTAAWYLASAGHEVTVIDRQPGAGLETSFANGGQISASHAEPWANPSTPAKALKWLGREDAPLLFRLRADPRQWAWALSFLIECLPSRSLANTRELLALALHSRDRLGALRRETGIEYDQRSRGILQFFIDPDELERAARKAAFMRELGCEREVKNAAETLAIEPALAGAPIPLAGSIYTPTDESGDACKFTQGLAKLAAERGVRFRYGCTVRRLETAGDRVAAAVIDGNAGSEERASADAYVVALGSYSPQLLRTVGVSVPVYPLKGYSITVPLAEDDVAPQASLTDESAKLVFSRLGDRLRVAGTAELTGYDTSINRVRCEAIVRRTRELFPRLSHADRAEFWSGLRPATPSNVPLVGRTRYMNLFLDTGHGTLGWTMAAGSGQAIAEIVSGRRPEVAFRFLGGRSPV
jgi:D-amino-acid dehydrogenase